MLYIVYLTPSPSFSVTAVTINITAININTITTILCIHIVQDTILGNLHAFISTLISPQNN